ncbi:hypothetical protein LTR17_019737 [Elasticomyces elasticus]|nr:hypothetical protein LTR17_019737 [Elasticomyces elasticus]
MSPTLPTFDSFALITQLKYWTTRLSEGDENFLAFYEDEDTFPKSGISDGPDINYHLDKIVEAMKSFEKLHQKSTIKAAFPTSQLVVSLQGAAVEKTVIALDGLGEQLQGVRAAAEEFRGRKEEVTAANEHISACLKRDPTSDKAKAEDAANQKIAALSSHTTESIGNAPRPGTSDERAKVIKSRWDQITAAEQSRDDAYQRYRLLENTIACLKAVEFNLTMFVDSFQNYHPTVFNDAKCLFLDLYGLLYCGDIAEVKRLLEQDFAPANQTMVDQVCDSRFLSTDAFVSSGFNRTVKVSKGAKTEWHDPGFGDNTVYGISRFQGGGSTGGTISVAIDASTQTMQMRLSGANPYGEVDFFHLDEPPERAQAGNVILKPSSNIVEVVEVIFTKKIPEASRAACWLTGFSLEGSANQGSKKAANIDCTISALTPEGFKLTVVRPTNSQSDVGVGWLAYDKNAFLSHLSVACLPFLPYSWNLDATASNELWHRKHAVKYDVKGFSPRLPHVVGFVSYVRSYDAVRASVEYTTRNGALVHTESRGNVNAKIIASGPDGYLDMLFIP